MTQEGRVVNSTRQGQRQGRQPAFLQVSGLWFVVACFLLLMPFGHAEAAKRSLYLYNTHTKETARIVYKRNGRFDPAGLQKMNRFLRDWRRNESTKMDPRLFDLIWEVYRDSGSKKPIHVVSGYRSPATNKLLRKRGRGVARKSQHILGKAMDFYLPDVPISKLRNIGLRKEVGGVGYYPRSGSPFVHMDTGRIRHWPRMTRKQLAKVFPSGNTVHIPSDGKPLSGYKRALAANQKRKATQPVIQQARRVSAPARDRVDPRTAPRPNPEADAGRNGRTGLLASLFSSNPPTPPADLGAGAASSAAPSRAASPGAVSSQPSEPGGATEVAKTLPEAPPVPSANPNRPVVVARATPPQSTVPVTGPEASPLVSSTNASSSLADLGNARPVNLPDADPTEIAKPVQTAAIARGADAQQSSLAASQIADSIQGVSLGNLAPTPVPNPQRSFAAAPAAPGAIGVGETTSVPSDPASAASAFRLATAANQPVPDAAPTLSSLPDLTGSRGEAAGDVLTTAYAPEIAPDPTAGLASDIPLPTTKPLLTSGLPTDDPYAGERPGDQPTEVTSGSAEATGSAPEVQQATADANPLSEPQPNAPESGGVVPQPRLIAEAPSDFGEGGRQLETPVEKPAQIAALSPDQATPRPRPQGRVHLIHRDTQSGNAQSARIETGISDTGEIKVGETVSGLSSSPDPAAQLSSGYNTYVVSSLMNTEVTTRGVYFSAFGNADPNGVAGLMQPPKHLVDTRFRKGGQTRLRTHQFSGASVVGLRVLVPQNP